MAQRGEVSWSLGGGIGRIVLQRPQAANALDYHMCSAFRQSVDELLARDPRVVVLSAEGSIFCAGGDVREFVAAGDELEALVDRILDRIHPAIFRLATAPCAVVSVVNGPVGGAGVALALCADFVLAADTMKLRTGYAALGLSPDAGASCFLTRRIGAARARQWFMLSDPIDARTCLETGVVDAVYPAAELAYAAEALVLRLAQAAPGSMASIKKLCDSMEARDLMAHLNFERELMLQCATSADGKEGVCAFSAKRSPRFGGG